MNTDFKFLTVVRDGRVATVTIDNPPVNVITTALLAELDDLSVMLKQDSDLTVVVMRSADPDFFLSHFDVSAILERSTAGIAQRDAQIKPMHSLCERFRTMNKIVIGQIEGRIGGGGSELAANFDMRFGVRGKTCINQMEVPLGIMPGGTGTQRLPRLVGHGRAMELILSGDDMDAETAERWGYLNGFSHPKRSRLMSLIWRAALLLFHLPRCGLLRRVSTIRRNLGLRGCWKRLIYSRVCCALRLRGTICNAFWKLVDKPAREKTGLTNFARLSVYLIPVDC